MVPKHLIEHEHCSPTSSPILRSRRWHLHRAYNQTQFHHDTKFSRSKYTRSSLPTARDPSDMRPSTSITHCRRTRTRCATHTAFRKTKHKTLLLRLGSARPSADDRRERGRDPPPRRAVASACRVLRHVREELPRWKPRRACSLSTLS